MSAYQVNRDTIDLMVSVLVAWDPQRSRTVYSYGATPTDPELELETERHDGYAIIRADYNTATALGRELIKANIDSLCSRYSDGATMCGYLPHEYKWQRVLRDDYTTPARAMGAVNCYRYQSCEHKAWRGSFADELSQRVLDRLVDIVSDGWDYERPPTNVVSIFELAKG